MIEIKQSHPESLWRFLCPGIITLLLAWTLAMPAAADVAQESAEVANPGTELWREVRQRGGPVEGVTQVRGVDAGTLINVNGQAWRQLRVEKVIPYSGYLLGAKLLALAAFRLIRGEMKIEAGRSGKRVLRFSLSQRIVHWTVAVLFVVLGITGLMLLLGRTLLLPYIGSGGFAVIASISKTLHNYGGPVFSVALLCMLFSFIRGNFYQLKDIQWFASGGGMLGKHASAGRYNAGEKSWFWMAILGGAVVVASGLVLDFPLFDQTRETMQLAQIIHVIAGVVLLVASLGHIYMGTIAMEGALETMTSGYCDSNWAKEHHDEWYEEVKNSEEPSQPG